MTEPQTHDPQALREQAVSHYRAGDLLIDVGRQRVMRDERTIALPKLSFDLLVALARAAPNLVSSEALLRQVWPRVVVGPETLNQRVKLVRDALGDDSRHPRYVEGLRGRGYRLIPPVEVRFLPVAAPVSPDASVPHAGKIGAAAPAAPAVPVAPAVADHVDGPAAANGATGAALPEAPAEEGSAIAVIPVRGMGRRWRVRGLWLTSLLLALMAGTLVPSPWRRVTSITPPTSVQAIGVQPQSVAVLPFDNLGPTADDDYVALGVAGAVLHQLASDRQLIVVARSSSFSLGEPTPDAREAGRRLGVRYVIEGSVQHSGSLLRVTAQLIDTQTNREIWSTKLDRDFGAIFMLQDEIAGQVVREVETTLHADPAAHRAHGQSSGVG